MTSCKKVQRLLPMFAGESLEKIYADQIHAHLSNCSSCQSHFEKTRKLRSVLALKQHEQPDDFFFRNYLSEFHRRLYRDMLQPRSLWRKIGDALGMNQRLDLVLRGVGIGVFATVAIIILSLYSVHLSKTSFVRQAKWASIQSPETKVPLATSDFVLGDNLSNQKTTYVLDRVSYNLRAHESSTLTF